MRTPFFDIRPSPIQGLGAFATRRIRQVAPSVEVLVFTMHESEELIREVLVAGARGYLLKSDASASSFRLWRALRATSRSFRAGSPNWFWKAF